MEYRRQDDFVVTGFSWRMLYWWMQPQKVDMERRQKKTDGRNRTGLGIRWGAREARIITASKAAAQKPREHARPREPGVIGR